MSQRTRKNRDGREREKCFREPTEGEGDLESEDQRCVSECGVLAGLMQKKKTV